jgi:aspartyl-tRNA(Asn)/glutamyl-tRNA(Gln) amidotransferase subunit A
MTEQELAFASIEQIGELFRKRKLSPVELTTLMLQRAERIGLKLNAFITLCNESALKEAKQAETELLGRRGKRCNRGPLHGIPISLKDNISTAGVRTTAGSKILRDFVPVRDAMVVTQLREAGAVLLGKTSLHEFAYGVTSNNPHFGPVRNPWDTNRIPGGSSGGSAASVAAGLCYGSIGTDTGGSIRIPAALCGVVGLKPTFGRASVDGTIPLSPKLDCVGPLARTVADTAAIATALFSHQRKSRHSKKAARIAKRKRELRLGVLREFMMDDIAVEIDMSFELAIRALQRRGARLVDLSIPMVRETEDAGNQIAWAEATHYHQQAGWFPARASDYSEDVRTRIEMGAKVTATAYLKALEAREKFINAFHLALVDNRLDAVILPTTPIAAPLIGEETTAVAGQNRPTRALLLRFNRPANLGGMPAISVPCGRTPEGLPVGLQLIGAVMDEQLLLEIAAVVEDISAYSGRPAMAT